MTPAQESITAQEVAFVNRDKEKKVLESLLENTLAGHGCTVLITGEAGVGKTRLVSQFRKKVGAKNVLFLEGASYEQEGMIPYAPWVEIIQSLLKIIPPIIFRKLPEWVIGEIGPLVPRIISEAKELGLKAWLKGPAASHLLIASTDQDRIRLFQAIAELFNIIEDRGLVIFLDDIAWADHASLQLFHYLARRTNQQKLMLIGAYRDSELSEDHALAATTRDLSRLRVSRQISLSPLAHEHVAQLLEKQLSGPVAKELVGLINTRTGGNPFFIEEVVHSLEEQGLLERHKNEWTVRGIRQLEIPTSVKALIRQRVLRLGEDCVQVLSIASLAGMEFEFETLAKASGFQDETVLKHLESAVRTRLVNEKHMTGRVFYTFSDEQIREFFAEQLSLLRARKYHQAIGNAIEKSYSERIEEHLGELAHHFIQAAVISKARDYSDRAGDRSARLNATSDAKRHWANALELVEQDDPEKRLALLEKLARVSYIQANHSQVQKYCREAIDLATQLDRSAKAAELYTLLGQSNFQLKGDKENALNIYQEGLQALSKEPGTVQEAILYHEVARAYVLTGEMERASGPLTRAIDMASKLNAHEVLAHSYQTLAFTLPLSRKNEICSYLEKSLDLATEHHLDQVIMRSCNNLGEFYGWVKADYKRAESMFTRGLGYAEKLGSIDFLSLYRGGLCWDVYYPAGEWEKCETAALEAIQIAEDAEIRYPDAADASLGAIALARGDFGKAKETLHHAVSRAQRWLLGQALPSYIMAGLNMALGEFDAAEENLAATLQYAQKLAYKLTSLECLFSRVLLSLKQRKVEEAATRLGELQEASRELDEDWGRGYEKRAEGLVLAAQGETEKGILALAQSIDLWRRIGRPYDLAQTLKDCAVLQEKTGKEDQARQLREEAARIYTRLGVPPTQ